MIIHVPSNRRRLQPICVALMMILALGLIAVPAQSGDEPERPLSVREATRGSLVLRTGQAAPERWAPMLTADVQIEVTGLIARVVVHHVFRNPTLT